MNFPKEGDGKYALLRPWLIAMFLLITFGFYTFWTMLPLNLLMVSQIPSLMDTSYTTMAHLAETNASIDLVVCQYNSGSPACVHALLNSINTGLFLEELTPYLEELTPHPEQQTIVASYAGEIWYGAQRQSDALNIWGTWLTPNQKIDKASRLYQAGQAEDALLLVHTLDLENRVESGIRRSNLNQILVDAAQKQVTAGNDDSAELYWRWAIIQFPERANYAFNLGMTFYRRERFEDALFPFQEAVRLSPESTSYQVRLAQTLIQLERIDEARAIVVNILELDPTNEIARALHEQLNNR